MHPQFILFSGMLAALSCAVPWRQARTMHTVSLCFSLLTTSLAWALALPILAGATAKADTVWMMDAFSALMLALIGLLSLSASLVSVRYLAYEEREGVVQMRHIRMYYACFHLFVLAMMTVVMANNILMMWIALEATTLTTTLLVAFYIKEGAIEAAWKYIILCSTGIALGLIGLLITLHAASSGGQSMLQLTALWEQAGTLPANAMRWAFVFMFVGIGTKVGLVPMHTWLPDAHSKTPAPVSALLSGILLNVALYTILRFKLLTDTALGGSDWTNMFFLIFGVLSVAVPAFIMLVQQNYKRLLAYSSIEHMGLMVFAIGLGSAGAVPAVLHMVGHSLTKSLLFFGAGEIILQWKSTKVSNVHALINSAPVTGILFLVGMLMILAVPPSPLFISEFLILFAGMQSHPVLTGMVILLLTIVFIGMMRPVVRMVFGHAGSEPAHTHVSPWTKWNPTHAVMLVHLMLLLLVSAFFFTQQGMDLTSSIANLFTLPPQP